MMTSHPLVLRVCWWIRLLKIFGGLRSDDLQRLSPVDCRLTPEGLSATLRRTKTTGPNKRVKTVPLHIPVGVSVSGEDWLATGYQLWAEVGPRERDYFLPRPAENLDGVPVRAGVVQRHGRTAVQGHAGAAGIWRGGLALPAVGNGLDRPLGKGNPAELAGGTWGPRRRTVTR